jgi:ABC-type transporter Mla subunit MlaD
MPDTNFNEEKDSGLKAFLILLFIFVAILGAIWFFGWRANQGEIIQQKSYTVTTTTAR